AVDRRKRPRCAGARGARWRRVRGLDARESVRPDDARPGGPPAGRAGRHPVAGERRLGAAAARPRHRQGPAQRARRTGAGVAGRRTGVTRVRSVRRVMASGSFGVAMLPAGGGAFAPVPGLPTGDRVFALAFASPGELWLQRLSGLEQYRLADGRWQRDAAAGSEEGLPAVEGSGLAVDPLWRAWLASTRGLHRWDPQAGRLRSFGLSDGLSSQEFLDQGMVLGDSGVLAAALADGSVMLLDTM